jgi:hypothetical protein
VSPRIRSAIRDLIIGAGAIAVLTAAASVLVSRPVLHAYLGVPYGELWPNFIAAAVCVGIGWWRIRARMIAHHLQVLAQAQRHHEDLKEHLAEQDTHLSEQDEALKRAGGMP